MEPKLVFVFRNCGLPRINSYSMGFLQKAMDFIGQIKGLIRLKYCFSIGSQKFFVSLNRVFPK